jgi:putative ABC transport system permease protein
VRKHVSAILSASDRHLSIASADELTSNDQVLDLINATARWISVIAGLVGLVVIANTMITAMNERTSEIGLLHAVGWSPIRVFAMVIAEALAIAACAGTLGVAIGAVAIRVIVTNGAIAPFVPGSLDLVVAFSVWMLTLVISVFGALLPAYRAGRIDPAMALAAARR